MKDTTKLEIQAAAAAAAIDAVKAQIAKGQPNKGMSKARHVATVAQVIDEMLRSFDDTDDDGDLFQRRVLQAALSGSLLNASQFRQELEKDGVLVKETALSNEYNA